MNARTNLTALATAGVALLGLAYASGAAAATQPRQIATHPTNLCQSALPVFDGNIRKRPLAVQNEGAGTAFVTCSYPSGEGRAAGISPTTRVWQYFVNNTGGVLTVACTGVSGYPGFGNEYIVKSLDIPANSTSAQISWFAADFSGSPATFPGQSLFSISCSIPPGAGLGQAYINSETDVGN